MVSPNGPRIAGLRARCSEQSRRLEGEDREDLRNRDRHDHRRPERLQRRLLEREVRRYVDVATEERVEVLADEEARRCKHTHTTMLQLDLPVELDLALRDVVSRAEAQRIEEAKRTRHPRKRLRVLHTVERGHSSFRFLAPDSEHEELLLRRELL